MEGTRGVVCGRKWFRAFQMARMSPQETVYSVFLPKIKLSTVTEYPILVASSCTHMRICVHVGTRHGAN